MKWLITGSGGYIGAHLISKLSRFGLTFLPLVGKSLSSMNRLRYLGVEGQYVALSDSQKVKETFKEFKADVVVHLASLKSPEESNKFPELYFKNNLEILKNVFEASALSGAKIFLNASSSAIYGNLDSDSISESDEGIPVSAYGESKLRGEAFLDNSLKSNLSICSLRFFNVVGSLHPQIGETAKFHLVPATIYRLTSGERPLIYGYDLETDDGTPIRDYVHVVDAIAAIQSIVDLMSSDSNKIYRGNHLKMNIGSGHGTSVLEVTHLIQKYMKTDFEPEFRLPRSGDPVKSVADISLAKKLIKFAPTFSISDIIRSCFIGSNHP